jgi:hypothetical protein
MKDANQSVSSVDQPPIMRTWTQVYWLVILFNVVLISLLYWFTQAFA